MKKILLWGLAALLLPVLIASLWAWLALRDLPDVSVLKHYRPPAASEVLDRDGALITHYYDRKFRVWVPIASQPDLVIQAVVTAEDDTFFGHEGVNYRAVWEALKHDVQKKRFARGGSTITQQMIKNVLLTKEKTLSRKLKEFVLARQAEELLTKRRILEIYLNEVEWGENIHGIEAASRYYFDKHASELTNAESALLAGMLPNPKYYNPFKRPDKARQRQERVLFNMFQAKLLTPDEYGQAMDEPVRLRDASSRRFDLSMLGGGNGRSCHLKALEEVLVSHVGEAGLYRQGLKIRTTIDKALQDGIAAFLSAPSPPDGVTLPESILVVREGTDVRALACSADEDRVRLYLNASNPPLTAHDVLILPMNAVPRGQILLPDRPAASTVATGPSASGQGRD